MENTFSIPQIYLLPTGGPLYWRNEASGVLPSAVKAFFNKETTDAHLRLVQEYIEYYIHAPCWDLPGNPFADELKELRELSKTIKTEAEIFEWIFKALDIGIDPF